jgi:hypothetical protein
MRLTLAAAAPLLARYAVQGACATDPRVLEKINEARQRLMEKPQNWKGKIQRFLFCASRACVTLPREIETVEAATVCNTPMQMRSKWYDVLESGPGSGTRCGGDAVIDRGDGYVSFLDFDEARNVKVYADVPESAGARLLLQGFDSNGNRVRTWDAETSAYVDGEYVGINNETPAVSVTVFSGLDGIQKPETNGFVRLYAFTAGTAGSPLSDITTIANTDGSTVGGTGTLQPELVVDSATWTPLLGQDPGSFSIVLSWSSNGADWVPQYAYNLNGELLTFPATSDDWTAGVYTAHFDSFDTDRFAYDLDIEISSFPDPAEYSGQSIVVLLSRAYTAAVSATPDYSFLMAILHPDETAPSYRRYEIPALRRGCNSDDEASRQVILMAKLRYLPVKRATDFLIIENIGALKQMLLAINAEEKNEFDTAQRYEAKAEKILGDELQNHIGDATTANQPMQVQQDVWAAGNIDNIL